MPRFGAGLRSTGGGSTTLPVASIYAASSAGVAVREIGVWNTTTTPFCVQLIRLASTGTQGTGAVEDAQDPNWNPGAQAQVVGTHSGSAPTAGNDMGYRAGLGAAIGAGVIWTFGDRGLVIAKGSTNGIGILPSTGTGQIVDCYFVWDE